MSHVRRTHASEMTKAAYGNGQALSRGLSEGLGIACSHISLCHPPAIICLMFISKIVSQQCSFVQLELCKLSSFPFNDPSILLNSNDKTWIQFCQNLSVQLQQYCKPQKPSLRGWGMSLLKPSSLKCRQGSDGMSGGIQISLLLVDI